ncbi:hypothetical protein [Leuconostoc rapi]|uniref:hypothetical protein n=1 Tax=Leuconostoc rapi TaxID=1406906 RepID=UPI0019599C5F|nr:hypothetical protein [Leuconostoc rapi]MBM7434723.1 amino acid transporter [Leuconostoc rapi]
MIKNLTARILLGILTFILFIIIFWLSSSRHWSLGLTISLVVVLMIIVNMAFTWLFWQSKKQRLNEEKDD